MVLSVLPSHCYGLWIVLAFDDHSGLDHSWFALQWEGTIHGKGTLGRLLYSQLQKMTLFCVRFTYLLSI